MSAKVSQLGPRWGILLASKAQEQQARLTSYQSWKGMEKNPTHKASARLSLLPMFPLVYKGTLHTDMRGDVFSKAVRNVECKACRQAHRSGRISQQSFQSQWHLQSSSSSSTLSCVTSLSAVYSSALLVWLLLVSKSTAYSQALCQTRFNTNPSPL